MHIHTLLIVFILSITINLFVCDDVEWDYAENGPDVWQDLYPSCGTNAQSPIDINTGCTTYQSYEPFHFSPAYNMTQNFFIVNNGHTIGGIQMNASAYPLVLSGGGLDEPFTFVNFHLHWGKNYASGSEHQLNGKKYTAEVHFVHSNAAGTRLAVLGVFLQTTRSMPSNSTTHRRRRSEQKRDVSNNGSPVVNEWNTYFQNSSELNIVNESTVFGIKMFNLLGENLNNFYRYSGSLTVPPCTENVIWTVFQTPVVFNQPVLDAFRTNIYPEDYRGPQPLNGRSVYRSFSDSTPSTISDYNCCRQQNQTDGKGSNANSILSIDHKQLFSYLFIFMFSFLF